MSQVSNYKKLALAYYGDDFTGSTDALEFLCRAGLKTRLYLKPPADLTPEIVEEFDAIGLAGRSRSMNLKEMETELVPAFNFLASLHPEQLHYKVCSTFDSSPETGSIGRALEIGKNITNASLVPLLVGAPILGRYCFMGNLFARMGIGSDGLVYRLDRHPSMSNHPVTPALESDLRLHLAKQTTLKTGLLSFLELARTDAATIWEDALNRGEEILLIDAFEQEQMTNIGTWLDAWAKNRLLFTVGSSGIEMALGQFWNQQGRFGPTHFWPTLHPCNQLLVVSGSCSPVTGSQIEYALLNGFDECCIEIECISKNGYEQMILADALKKLSTGNSLILHANGTRNKQNVVDSSSLGIFLGRLSRAIMEAHELPRVLIAGGDTSGLVALQLEIDALEMVAPLSPGAPVCKAISSNHHINGKEFVFKGGQLGTVDYFEKLRSQSF